MLGCGNYIGTSDLFVADVDAVDDKCTFINTVAIETQV
jgi:hypothetical protein